MASLKDEAPATGATVNTCPATVDAKLEIVVLPVSDVDRAKLREQSGEPLPE